MTQDVTMVAENELFMVHELICAEKQFSFLL